MNGLLKSEQGLDTSRLLFSWTDIRKLIVPLCIEQALVILVGLVDSVMVSHAGETAMAGISLIDIINKLVAQSFTALATGGTVVVSQYMGAKNREKAEHAASQVSLISVIVGAALAVVMFCLSSQVLTLLFGKVEEDVMESALIYLRVTALSYPFLGLYSAGAAIFRARGNSRIAMKVNILGNIINIIGNAICIFGFKMAALGVAIPTFISRVVICIIIISLASRDNDEVVLRFSLRTKLERSLSKRILDIGIPGAFQSTGLQIGRLLVVSIIATYETYQVSANAVANNLDFIGNIIASGVGVASVTIVARCVGAGDRLQARYYARRLLALSWLGIIVMNTFTLVALPLLLKLYGELSLETVALTKTLVWIYAVASMFLWAPAYTPPSFFRACGDSKYSLYVTVVSIMIFRVGGGYILGTVMGLKAVGIWIAMAVDWACNAVLFLIRFHGSKWLDMYKPDAKK